MAQREKVATMDFEKTRTRRDENRKTTDERG